MGPSKSKGVVEIDFFISLQTFLLLVLSPFHSHTFNGRFIYLHVAAGTIAPYLGLTKLGQATTREMILPRLFGPLHSELPCVWLTT